MSVHTPSLSDERKHTLQRRIRWIVTATIAYNLIEAVVAITAGTIASSSALIAFGLDSTIEVLSAAAVAWQFTRRDPERWEKGTLRVIAVAFFALAAYVTASSLLALILQADVEHSTLGLVITALSVLVMPFLSLAERRAGRELGSATAVADSKQTLICTYLSAAVLVGLVLNSMFGWWWADAIAGLVIAGFAVREGIEAWRGDACATSVGMLLEDDEDEHS
ncbi:cation diffusion facilitator family transporter [Agromyces aureus]|uniref:Cobalt transporter n=1 Tax=Agromyces aureus TaxID=453304 RepID=A0A191WBW3_9MICO|nr:cation transporter [Agromyces aureus]ANJ25746.1 cobalt transporter [Agromyces aureus]